ncbi:MAG: XdhC family protein [Deltaproteobacteria bacterium]|nr:XdhC family protein [Deltaproteobacteria bacterium]
MALSSHVVRELRDILDAFGALRGDQTAILASVVHTAGSTYRRPGARLLVLPGDEMIGLIGGGCLEGDLLEHALRVRASDEPTLVHYDATAEDDLVWGLGLGCAGVVDVLLEPVSPAQPGPLTALTAWRATRETGALATGLEDPWLGRHWALHPDGRVDGAPDDDLRAALAECLESGRGRQLPAAGGRVSIEIARPPLRLVIFGAGPDAMPVARLALELGWEVELSDPRPAYAQPERFPGARVVCVPSGEAVAQMAVRDDTYTIVMTHHYLHDRALLAGLLPSATPYIGLLGPRQRADDLIAELLEEGVTMTEKQLERLHGPAGLDLGGDGPEAIALSLIAEIQAVAEGRSGGWLRARKGPIHDPLLP